MASFAINPNENDPFAALPAEILQTVLTYLDKADILAIRRSCSSFFHLGLQELFQEISITHRLSSFERIREISHQPHIARLVRSLHYQADVFKPLHELEPDLRSWWVLRHYCPVSRSMLSERASYATEPHLKAYDALCKEQRWIRREQVDSHCLTSLLKNCSNMNEITVAFGTSNYAPDAEGERFHYLATVNDPPSSMEDSLDLSKRSEILEMLADAVSLSGSAASKLKVLGLNVEGDELGLEPAARRRIDTYLQRLTDLEVHLQDVYIEEAHSDIDGTVYNRDFIGGAAPTVQTLTVVYPHTDEPWENGTHDRKRYHQQLVSGLDLRASAVLGEIVAYSAAKEWETFFDRLSGRNPKLEQIAVQGRFTNEVRTKAEMDFSDSCARPLKTAVEEYITKGGTRPELVYSH